MFPTIFLSFLFYIVYLFLVIKFKEIPISEKIFIVNQIQKTVQNVIYKIMLLKMLKVTFTEFVFCLLFSSKTESQSNQLKSVFFLKIIHISLNFKIKFKHTFCSVLFIIIKRHHLSKYHNFILFILYIYNLEVYIIGSYHD